MMKHLFQISLFLLICLNSYSQTDTIISKNGKIIIGTITLVNDNNIFYNTKKSDGEYIGLNEVSYYSKSGKRLLPTKEKIKFTNGDSLIGTITPIDEGHVRITRADGTSTVVLSSMVKSKEINIIDTESAGENLIEASSIVYGSTVIMIIGAGIAVVGAVIALPVVAIVGGVITLGGWAYSISAWAKINQAGAILKKHNL